MHIINDAALREKMGEYARRAGRAGARRKYITPEIEWKVNMLLDKWFPVYAKYELVEK